MDSTLVSIGSVPVSSLYRRVNLAMLRAPLQTTTKSKLNTADQVLRPQIPESRVEETPVLITQPTTEMDNLIFIVRVVTIKDSVRDTNPTKGTASRRSISEDQRVAQHRLLLNTSTYGIMLILTNDTNFMIVLLSQIVIICKNLNSFCWLAFEKKIEK